MQVKVALLKSRPHGRLSSVWGWLEMKGTGKKVEVKGEKRVFFILEPRKNNPAQREKLATLGKKWLATVFRVWQSKKERKIISFPFPWPRYFLCWFMRLFGNGPPSTTSSGRSFIISRAVVARRCQFSSPPSLWKFKTLVGFCFLLSLIF